jgi:hypothetical protein
MKRLFSLFLFAISLILVPHLSHASLVNRTATDAVTSGLTGWWTFDGKDTIWTSTTAGTVKDKSSSGLTGTLTSMNSSFNPTQGVIGQALKFDGTNDYVTMGNVLNPGTNSFSISVWAKTPIDNLQGIVANSGTTVIRLETIQDGGGNGGGLRLYLLDAGATTIQPVFGFFPQDNKWHHVVVTVDRSTALGIKLYFDGVERACTNNCTYNVTTLGSLTGGGAFVVGARAAGSSLWNGSIDEVRYYNKVLSASEARQLYNQGGQGKQNSTNKNVATSGLVGWWTFDGKDMPNGRATDSSGNGRTGYGYSGVSTSTLYTQGKIGQALKFGAANSFIRIPTAASLTVPYTISLWFNQTNSGGNQSLLSFGLSDPLHILHLSGGSMYLISAAAGTFRTFCNTTFTTNRWYHLVFVVNSSSDASQWKCYVDGEDIGVSGSDSSGTYGNPGSTDWTIGAYYNNSYWFVGKIDDVRIYSKSLSAADIKTLYSVGGQGKQNVSPASFLTSGLVGLWTFDGKDMISGVAKDGSGNGNTGYAINIATSSFYTSGKMGQGLKFDGVNDYIKAGSASSLDDIQSQGGGGMTVAFWIKPVTNATKTIIAKGLASDTAGFWMIQKQSFTDPARILFQKEGVTDMTASYNDQLTTGVWTHIVLTWSGSMTSSGVVLYKNGVLQAQSGGTDGATARTDASNDLTIGGEPVASDFMDGSLDGVRIYNRILSQTEVTQLYNLGR